MISNAEQVSREKGAFDADPLFEQPASSTLAACLNEDAVSSDQLKQLASMCATPYALIAIELPANHTLTDVEEGLSLIKGMSIRNVCAIVDNLFITFTTHADAQRLLNALSSKSASTKLPTVISLPFDSIDAIHRECKLVRYCLAHSNSEQAIDAEQLAFSYLKTQIENSIEIEGLLHPALMKLAHYDEVNHSGLFNTLKVYLEYDRNAQRCANVLFLHRNSLQYRIRRIQEITGVDLDNPKERCYLRLSFLLSS